MVFLMQQRVAAICFGEILALYKKNSKASEDHNMAVPDAPSHARVRLRWWRIRGAPVVVSGIFTLLGIFFSCSTQDAKPREIRGHNQVFSGIPHGIGASKAWHLCTECHGVSLMGGAKLEPSCYSCHGKNWLDEQNSESMVPADHTTVVKGQARDYRHHPNLSVPMGKCSACHGLSLEGDPQLQRPSCVLCHAQLWER